MKSKLLFVSCLAALACASSILAGTSIPQTVPVFMGHGAPSNGSDEVQIITIADGATSGSFRLKYNNFATPVINWNGVVDQLAGNIQRALNAVTVIGPNGVVVASTDDHDLDQIAFTVTFSGPKVKRLDVPQLTVKSNDLVGDGHGISIVTSVAGVTADGRGGTMGAVYVDCDAGKVWCNTGMPPAVNWTNNSLPLGIAQGPEGHDWSGDTPTVLGGFSVGAEVPMSVVLQADEDGGNDSNVELVSAQSTAVLQLVAAKPGGTSVIALKVNVGTDPTYVRFDGLPTSASGLTSGRVWRDAANSNVLKIVP